MVGAKYLELSPGSSSYPIAEKGLTFERQGRTATSLETVLKKVESIAKNVESVSNALKESIGSDEQKERLKSIVKNVDEASAKISHFSDTLVSNENNLTQVISDVRKATHKFNSVLGKIDDGKGMVGKLVNDSDLYDDLKVVSCGFRKAANVAENIEIFIDNHFESMFKPAENYVYEDAKGYFGMRFRTNEDSFYLVQGVASQKGNIDRSVNIIDRSYINQDHQKYTQKELEELPGNFWISPSEQIENLNIQRNQLKFSVQVGKVFTNLAMRFGIFENSVGVGLDYELPLSNERFRWITSFEAFDLRGQNRINDTRPHLKWINKLFFLDNVYLAFGADDFVSKHNANAFIGGGIRFTDDDLKYLIAKMNIFDSIPLANK